MVDVYHVKYHSHLIPKHKHALLMVVRIISLVDVNYVHKDINLNIITVNYHIVFYLKMENANNVIPIIFSKVKQEHVLIRMNSVINLIKMVIV
jgi:hypothetical protein